MEPTFMTDAHGNSFWVTKTFMQPEINMDPVSDPLALDVKPKPEPSSVKLEPGTEPNIHPLDTTLDNVTQFVSPLESSSVNPDTDPLNIVDYTLPKMESAFESLSVKQEPTTTPRSPPRFVPFNSSTLQARSIEPSTMNIKTEIPSVMQDSLPQGILLDSRSAENRSSSVFNESPQLAVALSNSTDNQVFDSVSSPCRSDCLDSESRDDDSQDSIQHTSDTSLAVKYNLKQCSVSLRRVGLSFAHTAPVIDSVSSSFQSSVKEQPSTSRRLKRPRKSQRKSKSIPKIFSCKVCSRVLLCSRNLYLHEREHPEPHVACTKCVRVFNTVTDLEYHNRTWHMKDYSCDVCGKIYMRLSSLMDHKYMHMETPPTCTICNRIFSTKSSLKIHTAIHNKVAISCNICGKSYSKVCYERHMKTHNKEYVCDKCAMAFCFKFQLEDHLKIHLNKRNHVCELCGKSFATKSMFKSHMNCHNKKARCTICGKSFRDGGSLKRHQASHSEVRNHKCNLCGNSFKTKTACTRHMRTHMKEFKCAVCGKLYARKDQLENHMLYHNTKIERHPCLECDKTFFRKKSVKQHVLLCHKRPSDGRVFSCSYCSKDFSSEEELKSHLKSHGLFCVSCDLICLDFASMRAHLIKVHGGEIDISCKTGGISCKSLEKLKEHQKVHTIKQCSVCCKNIKTKVDLELHMKTMHANEELICEISSKTFRPKKIMKSRGKSHFKPEQSHICSKTFSTRPQLNKHKTARHSTQPAPIHSCDVCSRSFTSVYFLKRHRRVHSKPYECEQVNCGKSFSEKKCLTAHQEVHIIEKIHKCDVCEKSFSVKSNLIKHKLIHVRSSVICTCHECGKRCKGRLHIYNHITKVHMMGKL